MQTRPESKTFVKIDDNILALKEVYGATFKVKEFGSSKVFETSLTEFEAATMLIFASGSIEEALNALAYVSKSIKHMVTDSRT